MVDFEVVALLFFRISLPDSLPMFITSLGLEYRSSASSVNRKDLDRITAHLGECTPEASTEPSWIDVQSARSPEGYTLRKFITYFDVQKIVPVTN